MINIYSDKLNKSFDSSLLVSIKKRRLKIQENSVSKYYATLLILDNIKYIAENVTIISQSSNIDILVEGNIQELIQSSNSSVEKKIRKNAKKCLNIMILNFN